MRVGILFLILSLCIGCAVPRSQQDRVWYEAFGDIYGERL